MIKEIKFKNWKSFNESNFYIENLTILIGKNSSGKSNFLDLLSFINLLVSGKTISEAFQRIRGERAISIFPLINNNEPLEIEIIIEDENENNYIYSIGIILEKEFNLKIKNESLKKVNNGRTSEFYRSELNSKNILEIEVYKTNKIFRVETSYENDIPIINKADLLFEKRNKKEGIKFVKKSLKNIRVFDPIPREIRRSKPNIQSDLKQDCSNLISFIHSRKDKIEIEEKILFYLKRLPEQKIEEISFKEIGQNRENVQLYCKEKIKGELISVESDILSDGTLRFIALIGILLCQPKGSLVAIEEIDNGIAPAKAKLLLKVLDEISIENEIDILVTTHNTALLNEIEREKLLPFVCIAYRTDKTSESKFKYFEDIEGIAKLRSFGNLGEIISEDRLEDFLSKEMIKNV